MIIGRGMIAKALANHASERVFFASGVSNSQCTDPAEFKRERDRFAVVQKMGEPIVYFGTLSTDSTPYVRHKRHMESLAQTVLRLPVVGGFSENPHTLLNHVANKIRLGETLYLQERARRRVVDVRDAALIAQTAQGITDVCPEVSYSIFEIVEEMERVLKLKAVTRKIPGGSDYKAMPIYYPFRPLPEVLQRYYG